MSADADQLANILEAAMLVAGKPMKYSQLESLFAHESEKPTRDEIQRAIEQLQQSYESKGIELVEVASGFRLQARQSMVPWITHLYQEKSPRYSRALMETLVLIAYRQPITRGEIEDVRGVAVSTNIIKTLLEREWIRVLGHRDVPGRPAILGTTRQFLDYFNLKRIDELPTLSEIKDLDQIDPDLAKEMALLESQSAEAEGSGEENDVESEADDTVNAETDNIDELLAESTNESAPDFLMADADDRDQPTSIENENGNGHASDTIAEQADILGTEDEPHETEAVASEDGVDLFLGDSDVEDESVDTGGTLGEPDLDDNVVDEPALDHTQEPRSMAEMGAELGESETLH